MSTTRIDLNNYNFLTIRNDDSDPTLSSSNCKIQVECRTAMTSITIHINSFPEDMQELIAKCSELQQKYINITTKYTSEEKWNTIGYCGVQFIEWLEAANAFLVDGTDVDSNNYVRKAYIEGVNMVYDTLSLKYGIRV